MRKICEVFGKVNTIELLNDPNLDRFTGIVNVEFCSELDAKRAYQGMMGLKLDDCVLDVKKVSQLDGYQVNAADGEVFKQLIEDKATTCLCLKGVVELSEIESRIDYKELEFDVQDEMNRYGDCVKVIVPRPPLFSDPAVMPGFGRVYVRFKEIDAAVKAKKAIATRRFNGRPVEVQYYPVDRFVNGVWA